MFGTLDEVLGHCRRYTEESLANVAQQAGFHVEQILKFNRPGVFAWWLNGRILKKRTFGLGQIRMLNILTPLFRLVDRWLPLASAFDHRDTQKRGDRACTISPPSRDKTRDHLTADLSYERQASFRLS